VTKTSSPYRIPADATDAQVLRLVPTPSGARTLARLLAGLFVATVLALAFAPWQQSADGSGRVIAYAPLDRQQIVEAPIDGRIVTWHVREGTHVSKGDPIVDISDNDPEILTRLREEREATIARIETARERVKTNQSRVASLENSRDAALRSAGSRIEMAKQRFEAARRATEASKAASETARMQVDRIRALTEQGLRSKRDLELAELDLVKTQTDYDRALAAQESANAEVLAMEADRLKIGADMAAAIDSARASAASALGDVASGSAELARIEVRLARQRSQEVVAPRDGVILRLIANQGTEMVKPGDALAILVPDTEARAVELWVDGNDVPLISEGRHVRLQFEGWPAVQFTGWPSVAVGTFGGKVALVDATDNGKGKFRVLVVPDGNEPWPSGAYLRQGTQANGWVLLNRVSLGYELWRRFNGFPPVVSQQEPRPQEKK
jgi:multidrug efflux pump subunit AcrA (membrane-fusion protein)